LLVIWRWFCIIILILFKVLLWSVFMMLTLDSYYRLSLLLFVLFRWRFGGMVLVLDLKFMRSVEFLGCLGIVVMWSLVVVGYGLDTVIIYFVFWFWFLVVLYYYFVN